MRSVAASRSVVLHSRRCPAERCERSLKLSARCNGRNSPPNTPAPLRFNVSHTCAAAKRKRADTCRSSIPIGFTLAARERMMGQQVVMGASLQCSFGMSPCPLVVLPDNRVTANYVPAATIMDQVPVVNIATFGMCTTQSNPAVAAATAAASGVPTPAPCVPVIPAPWTPGSPTVIEGAVSMPALNSTSTCLCTWGGSIIITYPGQVTVEVP